MMTGQRNKRLKYIVVTLSLLCYLTACVLSPYNYYENTEDAPYNYGGGLFCLLFGWAGMLFHEGLLKMYFLAWYSNITYLVAIICFIKNKCKKSLIWSVPTLVLALIFAFCPEIITDEAGHTHSITMAEGYYLWIVSFFVLFIGVIIYHKSDDWKRVRSYIRKTPQLRLSSVTW